MVVVVAQHGNILNATELQLEWLTWSVVYTESYKEENRKKSEFRPKRKLLREQACGAEVKMFGMPASISEHLGSSPASPLDSSVLLRHVLGVSTGQLRCNGPRHAREGSRQLQTPISMAQSQLLWASER